MIVNNHFLEIWHKLGDMWYLIPCLFKLSETVYDYVVIGILVESFVC